MCSHKKYQPGCYDCEERFLTVKSYNHRNPIEFQGRARNGRYFGIELEIEGNGASPEEILFAVKDELTTVWEFKRDGSLSGNGSGGVEFVSQPAILSKWLMGGGDDNLLKWIKKLPKSCRSHQTQTCGLHVHVNRSSLTDEQILKINYFVNAHQSKMEKLGRRKWNNYCAADGNYINRRAGREYGHYNRYKALNLTCDKTIEFRFFKGTLKVSSLKASIALVSAICEVVGNMSWDDLRYGNSWDRFVDGVKANPTKAQNVALIPYMKKQKVM